MDPRTLKDVIMQLEDLEVDPEVFSKNKSLLVAISFGLRNSKLKVPSETQPSFANCFRESLSS
ncbi:MAG TPA: hypothetical protein VN739_00120 [Nitrososphaerales archaeon]|nr:hypothetical protein [Nitrososphaerales archaeon]